MGMFKRWLEGVANSTDDVPIRSMDSGDADAQFGRMGTKLTRAFSGKRPKFPEMWDAERQKGALPNIQQDTGKQITYIDPDTGEEKTYDFAAELQRQKEQDPNYLIRKVRRLASRASLTLPQEQELQRLKGLLAARGAV